MAPTIEELRLLKDEDLIREHDEIAKHTSLGVSYYIDELSRRSNLQQSQKILCYTKWMTILTIIITFATLVNLYIAWKLLN